MFYCGYADGVDVNDEKDDVIGDHYGCDGTIRKRNSIVVPRSLACLPNDVVKVLPAHGLIYFQSQRHGFCKCNPRNVSEFDKIDVGFLKETGYVVTSFFLDSVFEEVILLLVKTVFNYKQQAIMKWRPGTEVVNEDEIYSLFQLDEDEIVVEISGTDDNGLIRTSKRRLWLIEKWRSKATDWLLKLLPLETPITQISCGKEHVVALTSDGSVLTMGKSTRGQLGTGSTTSCSSLKKIEVLEPLRFTKVVAGGWHSLALSESGDIYGWGWNESGQIGSCLDEPDVEDEGITKENIPKLIFSPTLLNTPLDVSFSDIFAGTRHSVAISSDGDIFSWGWNGYGQLGHGNQEEKLTVSLITFLKKRNVKNVICGTWSTVFVT